jgi:GH43 family beta-xylosidase
MNVLTNDGPCQVWNTRDCQQPWLLRRRVTWLMAIFVLTGGLLSTSSAQEGRPLAKDHGPTFRNPLKREGADPWLTYEGGWYYLATTTGRDIRLRRARHLGGLVEASDRVVWKDDHPARSHDVWAPEFHRLDGGGGLRWYLYYTASDGDDAHHRLYVAEGTATDPTGPYSFKAKLLTDPNDAYYAIDGTVLTKPDGIRYLIWCGRPSPAGQGLYIARMSNPWSLTGPRVYLPADGFGCDVVREGPVTLQRHGKIFLIYSACPADTPDYKLGMLMANVGSDLMKPSSWTQHPTPVFKRHDGHRVYGPGHNFFFKSPDGREDWIVYHAKSSTRRTYEDRSTRAQQFTWNEDGTPNFGVPLSLDMDIVAPSGEPND